MFKKKAEKTGLSTSKYLAYLVKKETAGEWSGRQTGIFVLNHSPAEGVIFNNLLMGKLALAVGKHQEKNNLSNPTSCFSPLPYTPLALKPDCPAVNNGFPTQTILPDSLLVPSFEYVHPLSKKDRRQVDKIDIGAYEYDPAFQ